jgi:SHS2 domain-containing protein
MSCPIKPSRPVKKSGFKSLRHEADAAFLVFGGNTRELFQNSGRAVFSLITDMRRIRSGPSKTFTVPRADDSLLIFLNELLFLWDTDRFIPKTVSVLEEGPDFFHVVVRGDVFDEKRHTIKKEVKAATYHCFSMETDGSTFKAMFVVDI